jgi:hypothetical protein
MLKNAASFVLASLGGLFEHPRWCLGDISANVSAVVID